MLHIVNGDSVGDKLKLAGMEGEVLVWREIYTEGPVFVQLEQAENRSIRGRFLEQKLRIPQNEWLHAAQMQERQLAEFRRHSDIVLWFEHDLFDQTMLCSLLHWFAGQDLAGTRLQLLSIGDYPGIEVFHGLGQLSAEQLAELSGTWQALNMEQLMLGKRAWEAYASASPEAIAHLLHAEDTSALPFLYDAFCFHLSRFPSAGNGLGIVEQTTLELLLAGMDRPLPLFRQCGDTLSLLGMGDIQYWAVLRRLASASHPLITLKSPVSFPGLHDDPEPFFQQQMTLTSLGELLANRQADWIALNGIHEWLGGVKLSGRQNIWRWDQANVRLFKK